MPQQYPLEDTAEMSKPLVARLQTVREQLERIHAATTALEAQLATLQMNRYRFEGAQMVLEDLLAAESITDSPAALPNAEACPAECYICPPTTEATNNGVAHDH